MKRKILVFTLIMALCCGSFSAVAAEPAVAATAGTVVIDTTLSGVGAGVPVMVLILPEINDAVTDEDITLSRLPQGTSAATIISTLKSNDLKVEYFDVVLTGAGGTLDLTCKMKPSLSTGSVHVYLKYLGVNNWVKLDEFEHVGQNDIDNLLLVFNGSASGYEAALATDISGNRLLEKSSADLNYYASLPSPKPAMAAAFRELLFNKRPAAGFDMLSLVATFNETCAWIKLREQADTLGILNQYNQTYWNVPTDDLDFTSLAGEEQGKILTAVKTGNHSDATNLLNAFNNELVLALFRTASTREDVDALIAPDGTYQAYFTEVRTMLANAALNEYQKLLVYNYVLDGNEYCTDFAAVQRLFSDGIASLTVSAPPVYGGGGGTSVGSNPIGGGIVTLPPAQESQPVQTKEIPFNDVAKEHWAYAYVKQLYSEKIINGTSETEFSPSNSIKRQDFVKILVGILNMELSLNDSTFTDLSVGCYYEPYIMTAAENGLISGVGDGSFGMNADITREDVAVIISRVLEGESEGEAKEFSDAANIADYAKDAVQKVATAGIFSGDDEGNFNPKANLSRAEACAVLCRLANTVKGVSK
ncbi:MAG: S-layer homology domain-containing protein [Clostridia bacterium]|nr:S-layer homology domain-containing protein [Clostridia bacterium]